MKVLNNQLYCEWNKQKKLPINSRNMALKIILSASSLCFSLAHDKNICNYKPTVCLPLSPETATWKACFLSGVEPPDELDLAKLRSPDEELNKPSTMTYGILY